MVSHAGGGGAHNPNLFYNMGRGSLPRNPKGKMPLHGRVAGFRQQPVNPVVPSWIEQQQQQQFFQVWPLTRFFFCLLLIKKLWFAWRANSSGKIFPFVPPNNSFVLVSDS